MVSAVGAAADGQQLLGPSERDGGCRWQHCAKQEQQHPCRDSPHGTSLHGFNCAAFRKSLRYKQTMRLPQAIAATLQAGGTVVASSPRAARALRRLYGEAQRERGLTAWPAPEIIHWDGWLDALWQQRLRSGSEPRLLLSPLQEHEIWVRLVKPGIEGLRLISIDGVADLAQQAYALLSNYDALDFLKSEMLGPDADSFCKWAREFERECREQGWFSRSKLPLILREAVLGQKISLPSQAILAGFDRQTPAQQGLLTAIAAQGCILHTLSNEAQHGEAILVTANDPRDEITTCAEWIRRELDSDKNAQEAGSAGFRAAVIVPDVSAVRSEVEGIFRRVLAPWSIAPGAPELPLPFEFSLGVPLSKTPMVRAALLLLSWMKDALRREEVTWLALSGFLWNEESDLLALAEFDAKTRRSGVLPPEYTLDAYLQQSGWNRSEASSGMRRRLFRARRAWRQADEELLSYADWAEKTQEILSAAGWPGAHRLVSEDFQLLKKWTQLLDSIATLAFNGSRVSYAEFLRVLKLHAEQTIFSPQSQNPPVEILGPFEAAGMEFDAIWFLGADDLRWPAPARPHPFIPKLLQKQHGMPHADDNADWELAKLVTDRIRKSAPRCVFSYSLQNSDANNEGQRRPSTALPAEMKTISSAQMREHLGIPEERKREQSLLIREEEQASGIAWPIDRQAGGQEVLKMQAACPFQAFATVRLHARELNREDWGLDAKDRGKLLHKALEGLWGELKDLGSLLEAKSTGLLHGMVERHVDQAIRRYRQHATASSSEAEPEDSSESEPKESSESAPEDWSSAYLQAERERVVRLIEEWLDYEAQRTWFTVERNEEQLLANVGELKLSLRADRIDQVEGGRLLIDYKTGKVSAASWEGDRPDEPQLPLYAAFGNISPLRGALLAQVRTGNLKFEGSVEEAEVTVLPGKSRISPLPYSEDLRKQWEKILLRLGGQFLQGDAQVDPKQFPKTCEFCSLPGLCRVAELEPESAEEDSGGGNGERVD